MAIYKCKMCGGNLNVLDGDSVVVCEFCETPQTISKTNDDKILKLYARGNELRSSNEFDKAYSVFEQILSEDEKDSEAYWNLLLCKYGITYVDDYDGTKKPTMNRYSTSSILEDEDYKRCLEYADSIAKEQYIFDANQISTIQNKITNIIRTEKPYDIFISYKETDEFGDRTNDSVLAQDIYNDLTKEGFRVFLSRVSLSGVIGNEYEPYIYAALYSSKIMILVTTDVEYVNSVWVKNEWSRYLTMSKNDSSKKLIPCYRGIDVYDLPKDLRNLQGVDMSKLGYLQDLKIGINKILGKGSNLEVQNDFQNRSSNVDIANAIFEALKKQKEEEEVKKYFQIKGSKLVKYDGNLSDITIPNSVTSIGEDAFSGCSSLTSITIPDSVTSIGNYAFYKCSSLTNVTIGNSVKSIGEVAFYNCSSLSSVYYAGTIKDWCNISFDSEESNPMYYASHFYVKNSNGEYEELTKIEIPSSITKINYCAFYGFKNVTKVTIPDSVTSIESCVFVDCSSLTSITIQNSVTSIGCDAFSGCSSLTSITIPNSVIDIGYQTFRNCSSLTSITIPDSVTSIESCVFEDCSSLTSITIPNSVTDIGYYAFKGCSKLTSITIPNSVTDIGYQTFQNCSSLTSITIPNSVTSIGEEAFSGCSSLTNITIPDSVTSIGDSAFSDCSSLTSITIPNSVTSIGEEVFSGCSSLSSVTIQNNKIFISDSAFNGCSNLDFNKNAEHATNNSSDKKADEVKKKNKNAIIVEIVSLLFSTLVYRRISILGILISLFSYVFAIYNVIKKDDTKWHFVSMWINSLIPFISMIYDVVCGFGVVNTVVVVTVNVVLLMYCYVDKKLKEIKDGEE